jgi:DNA polymerase I-like protein with 3'-5' exonuclease and polymerase domains
VVLNGREVVGTSYRKLTKTCNFALLYGAGNKRLAVTLHQPVEVATRLRGVYRETFATAIAWLDQQKNRLEVARRTNQKRVYAVTLSGRRRWFDIPVYPSHPANGGRVTVEAQEKWDADKEEWKKQMGSIRRQLANHVIQGLAADIMKEAECLWYEKYGYDEECRWVASIHDEGIVEVIQSRAEEASRNLEDVMYRAMSKYLKVVNLGKVEAVITPFWSH